MGHNIKSFFNRGLCNIRSGLKMNCVEILKEKGYNLSGYSLDTYMFLSENDVQSPDECESWFSYLEMIYG